MIRNGQKIYRVRGPHGLWLQKVTDREGRKLRWVADERDATPWWKLRQMRLELEQGLLADPDGKWLDGLPPASCHVVEYEVKILKTGREQRLPNVRNFYERPRPARPAEGGNS